MKSRPGLFLVGALPMLVMMGIAATPGGSPAGAPAPPLAGPEVVYLVRHAETETPAMGASPDPALGELGRRRASSLARTLADAGVTAILSSDLERTRATAAPLARTLGLEVELYDPGNLEELAARLRRGAGRLLVVGHSNTTPEVVALLGGEPGPPIDEETEYDRLYVLVPTPRGDATTVRLRYGPEE